MQVFPNVINYCESKSNNVKFTMSLLLHESGMKQEAIQKLFIIQFTEFRKEKVLLKPHTPLLLLLCC